MSDPLAGPRGLCQYHKSSFSEYGNVAYQIKGNEAPINMLANVLHLLTTLATGVGSMIFF